MSTTMQQPTMGMTGEQCILLHDICNTEADLALAQSDMWIELSNGDLSCEELDATSRYWDFRRMAEEFGDLFCQLVW